MNDLSLAKERDLPPPLFEREPDGRGEGSELVEYARVILKRRWSIVGLTLLVGLIAVLVTNNMRHTYRSTATILFENSKPKVVSIEEIYNQAAAGNREYMQTQVGILKSDDLARKVVKRLNLTEHPDFDARVSRPGLVQKYRAEFFPPEEPVDPPKVSEEDLLRTAAARVRGGLQVTIIRNTNLAEISFVSYDPKIAAAVPNELADAFIDNDLDSRVAMTQKATGWLRTRMGELRTKVDESERALQQFRERERIVDAKGLAQSGASQQLAQLSSSALAARTKRIETEAAVAQIRQIASGKSDASYESVPAVLRHPLVQRQKEVEGEAERRVAEAAKRYGPAHPIMIKARAELETAKENSQRQVANVVDLITREFEQAKANEEASNQALERSKLEIQSLNRKEFQLGVLERELTQNRNLYELFVNRLKETTITGDLETTIARVIDPALVPGFAFGPNKRRMVLTSAAVAFVVAALLALLLDRLSNTINSTGSVEERLGLPALGVLQLVKGLPRRKGFAAELAFFNDSQSTFAEAVRTVRTSVLMSALDDPHKVIVVTSSLPGEGKTTLSFNLACALGQVKKVLLIDADVRRPMIGRFIGFDTKAMGLSDLVAGNVAASECIVKHKKADIWVLPAGTIPPNPLEILSSERFHQVLEGLKQQFDIIVMDSAPVQLVSDAVVLSQHASGVIYVVRADSTPYQVARNGIRRLKRANARMMGVVLNQLDLDKAERYYGEYSGYRSYRGYKKYGYHRGYGRTYGTYGSDAKTEEAKA